MNNKSLIEKTRAFLATHTGSAIIHTDGACLGNPGPGGWAAIIHMEGRETVLKGRETPPTTNNRMEITAAIRALEVLPEGTPATIVSDSKYLVRGITEWLSGWKARGWRNANGKPTPNRDLWERLDALASQRKVEWGWVRGHAGYPLNERADNLANAEALTARSESGWTEATAFGFGAIPPAE